MEKFIVKGKTIIKLLNKRNFSSLNGEKSSRNVVHRAAEKGFTAAMADSYERGRPSYVTEALLHIDNCILAPINGRSPYSIVELGAGTGKFTECFIDSISYIAVEPSEGFLATLRNKHIPSVKPVVGTGANIPANDSSAEAVIVAQAFHWMANQDTLDEVYRVLKPGGALVLIWNTYDYTKDWICQLEREILGPAYGTSVPRQQSELWRNCFFTEQANKMFSSLHGWYYPSPHHCTRDVVIGRVLTTSVIAEMDANGQRNVLDKLNNILDNHPEFATARSSGQFTVPYITQIAWLYKQ